LRKEKGERLMGYKIGDEVLVKARIKDVSYVDMMYVCELATNPDVCIRFKSPTECIIADKTYESGLNDVWQLARKIVMGVEDGGFDSQEVIDVFGKNRYYSFKDFTAEEALAKIEAYEKEKEIKVGDVVEIFHNGGKGVVVRILAEDGLNIVLENGLFYADCSRGDCVKTGKHIDIESLLRQIGE
jgi:hypothetical protein